MEEKQDNEVLIPWEKIFVRHSIYYFDQEIVSLLKTGVYIFPFYYVNVKDSIHFKAITGNNYKGYNAYVKAAIQLEHNEYNFKRLLSEFDLNKMSKIKLNKVIDNYYVSDGLHRISIILFKDLFPNGIPIKYFKIIRKDKNQVKKFFRNKLKILILRVLSFAYSD